MLKFMLALKNKSVTKHNIVYNNSNVYSDNIKKNIYTILPIVQELYLQSKPIVKY